MPPITLTRSQARRFLLAYQALWPPHSLSGKNGALDFIRRVGCIQFDPLDMAGQNADLVLQSRIADYTPVMLRQLLYDDRKLVDGWDKQMAIYPVEDWPYFRRRRETAKHELRSSEAVGAIAPNVRIAIEQRGPLSSIDLEYNNKVDWWWAPTSLSRAALESMYFSGELIVHHKVHTRKVYDLTERHIPTDLLHVHEPNPNDEQYHDWYVLRRLGSVGLLWNKAGEAWLGMPVNSVGRKATLQRLLEHVKIQAVQVEGIDYPFYLRVQDQALLEETINAADTPPQAAFLAPLDNLVWDRRMLKELFGLDYRWEVYTPQKQRKYGYYVLPVLYGDHFVARIEPVRQKKTGILTVKNWWWEPGVTPDEKMLTAIQECFDLFCTYLSVNSIQFDGHSNDPTETKWLIKQLRLAA